MRRGAIIFFEMNSRVLVGRPSWKYTERCECAGRLKAGPAMTSSALGMDRQHRWFSNQRATLIICKESPFQIWVDLTHSTSHRKRDVFYVKDFGVHNDRRP